MFFLQHTPLQQHTQLRHPFSLAVALLTLTSMILSTACAFEARSGAEVVIPANETIVGDVYVTGRRVEIAGTVQGDVVAAAADIIISGQVTGDVIAAGRSVTLSGTLGDDARITGAILRLLDDVDIGGDVVASGYSLEIVSGNVAGDVVFGGRQAILAGEVTGDVRIAAEAAQLRGTVGGNANLAVSADGGNFRPPNQVFGNIDVPFVAAGLEITDSATISGNTDITTTAALTESLRTRLEAITTGNVSTDIRTSTQRFDLLGLLTRLVSFALLGVLLAWRAPQLLQRSEKLWRHRALASFGWGSLGLLALPAAVLLLVVVVVLLAVLLNFLSLATLAGLVAVVGGASALVAGVLTGLMVFFVTPLVSGYAAGTIMLRSTPAGANINVARATAPMLLGLVVLGALALVPVIGGLITFIATALGLGSVWLAYRQRSA